MTVTHYDLTESYEVAHVVPERDSIAELIEVAAFYNDEDCTWTVDGSAVRFKRRMGSTMTPREEQS